MVSPRYPDDGDSGGSSRAARLWHVLGPGLITGAADDDPSGIATYAQAGAQFGFQLGWTLLLTYPLMVVIQAISARIGRITGVGIAGNLRVTTRLAAAQRGGAAVHRQHHQHRGGLGRDGRGRPAAPSGTPRASASLFGVVCAAEQSSSHYTRYVRILKWLTLSLFAYFAAVCVVHVPWAQVLQGLVWPQPSRQGCSG